MTAGFKSESPAGFVGIRTYRDVEAAYRIGLKSLARRYLELHDEIADLDAMIGTIVNELAPELVARNSIGRNGAAQLLLTAADNPERLRSEEGFAALCGVSPVPASSARRCAIASIGVAIEQPTLRCTSSPSAAHKPTQGPRRARPAALQRATSSWKRSAP